MEPAGKTVVGAAVGTAVQRTVLRALAIAPPRIVSALVRPRAVEGQRLDPHVALLLRLERVIGRDANTRSPIDARADFERSMRLIARPLPELAAVEERLIAAGEYGAEAALDVRVYRPAHGAADGARPPALLYFHGGGGVIGSLETHHELCAAIAAGARAVVISVDYRLAPEHCFPAAMRDASAAFDWLSARAAELGVDARRLGVGGDSMGGNLSAALCQQRRAARQAQPVLQLLLYPWLDVSGSLPSCKTFARDYMLTRVVLAYFQRHYLGGADPSDPSVSPLFAASADLEGLAPALVYTAGFDPLRDEGRRYADRLAAAGVPVRYRCYDSLVHGFCSLAGVLPVCARAVDDIVAQLRRAFDALA